MHNLALVVKQFQNATLDEILEKMKAKLNTDLVVQPKIEEHVEQKPIDNTEVMKPSKLKTSPEKVLPNIQQTQRTKNTEEEKERKAAAQLKAREEAIIAREAGRGKATNRKQQQPPQNSNASKKKKKSNRKR